MIDAVDWLPLDALTAPRVTAALEAAIVEWGELWFVGRRLRLSQVSAARRLDAFAGLDDDWSIREGLVAISGRRGAVSRLVEWSLDRKVDERVATEADRELLDRYEDRVAGDLAVRLLARLGAKPGGGVTGEAGGLLATVADTGGRTLFSLQIPLEILSPFIKRMAPRRPPAPKLEPLFAAMSSTTVDLQALLGEVELSLQDLRELAPGDILVLDLGLDDPIELTLTKTGAVLAHAKLTESEGHRALVVHN